MLNRLIGLNQQKRNLIMHFFAGIPHPCRILHQGRYRNYFATMPLLKSWIPALKGVCLTLTCVTCLDIHTCIKGRQLLQQYVVTYHIFVQISSSPQTGILFVTVKAVQIAGDWQLLSSWGCWVAKPSIQLTWGRGEYLTCRGQEPSIPKKTSYIPHILPPQLEHTSVALAGPSFVCSVSRSCCCCHASNLHDHPRQHK